MGGNSKDDFAFDTSALISLGSVKLIDKVLEIANINVCQSVINELKDFSKFDDYYGKAGKEALKYEDKFVISNPAIGEKVEFIEETDNEIYNLAKEKSVAIITDDIKMSRHLEGKIDIYFSTYFLSALIFSRQLSKKTALDMLEELNKKRNWQNNLIYLASKKELENISN